LNVNLLVGARFNAGITANALIRSGVDISVYTSSPSKNWAAASKHVRFVPMPFRVLSSLAGKRIPGFLKERDAMLFDFMAARYMRKSHILHGWASFSLESGKNQKRQGGIFLLDRACPHARYQRELLLQEAELLKIKYDPMSNAFMERMEHEYQLADKILVPSSYTHKSFIEHGISRDKLEILRLDANFTLRAPRVRGEKRSGDFVVGTIGGNIIRKGFLYLLRAWKKLGLKGAKLLIKSSRSEIDKIPLLSELIKQSPTIEVVGYMENIESFYDQCDVFCLPSIDDGFGMVVLEALSCGLPVITTTNVGATEFVREGKNGFCVPIRDEDSLAECLQRYFDDPQLVERMSEEATSSYYDYKASPMNYEKSLWQLYSGLT
jgi:glycosyltransferase involved in cell wall biosynthesis